MSLVLKNKNNVYLVLIKFCEFKFLNFKIGTKQKELKELLKGKVMLKTGLLKRC